jgi:hypothetical protein
MKRLALALALAAALAVSAALPTYIAAASPLTIPQAHREIEQKAKQACALTCDAFGVRSIKRISGKKVSGVAFVRRRSQTCTDRIIVTKTSTAGLNVQADAYPGGWICR